MIDTSCHSRPAPRRALCVVLTSILVVAAVLLVRGGSITSASASSHRQDADAQRFFRIGKFVLDLRRVAYFQDEPDRGLVMVVFADVAGEKSHYIGIEGQDAAGLRDWLKTVPALIGR